MAETGCDLYLSVKDRHFENSARQIIGLNRNVKAVGVGGKNDVARLNFGVPVSLCVKSFPVVPVRHGDDQPLHLCVSAQRLGD